MKKLLLIILIILLVALSAYIALYGFGIANVDVLSYNGIREKSAQLDETIQEASKLAEKDYKSLLSDIENNTKKLMNEKKEYEDTVLINTENGTQSAGHVGHYKVEKLWVKLGTYATEEGIVLQMDIVNSSSGEADRYDLNFTVNGTYIGITDFISDIENDSELGFKIEGFTLNRDTSETDLISRFSCKNIVIEDIQPTTNTPQSSEENNSKETNNTTNTENTTNTTDTTNTTNTTNTTTNTNKVNVHFLLV